MDAHLRELIVKHTSAESIRHSHRIQSLWSGYGQILRVTLDDNRSVIVKQVSPPQQTDHPRGWSTDRSHERKLRSYQVESHWYRTFSTRCDADCRIPKCLAIDSQVDPQQQTLVFILEDLDASGFSDRFGAMGPEAVNLCVRWLANFHAEFMCEVPAGLWHLGTYWHLETRPDEWSAMSEGPLKKKADLIDRHLNQCQFPTFVHGDAKVANFCFHTSGEAVAAVDFQYVGGGCGIKDLAYLMGSCLDERDCQTHEAAILDLYFQVLGDRLRSTKPDLDIDAIQQEYRSLYCFAWADFDRFLAGWCPGHHKLNRYSASQTQLALDQLH